MASNDFDVTVVDEVAHRPWPMPNAPWVMTQTWNDLLFAHWPIDPTQLRAHVPSVFELDLFDGTGWLGVVPFHMTNVGPRGVPSLPGISAFAELNVRTYVVAGGRPGVFFFSLDAASAIAVRAARTLLNLPYYTASMTATVDADRIVYRCVRQSGPAATFAAEYGPIGPAGHAAAGSLEYFLTERYCLYHVDRRGRPYRLEIHHPPWRVQPARAAISANTMASASGIALPDQAPLLHFARRQDTVAWAPVRL